LISLAMLIKEVYEEQMEKPMDEMFLDNLADFNGRLFMAGLQSQDTDQQEK
jgi:hypothetical protein